MAVRRLRVLSPEAMALWDRAYVTWDAGECTIEDLCRQVGFGKTVVYERLAEARHRIEEMTTEEYAQIPVAIHERPGTEIDEAPYLAMVDTPLDAVRPSVDPETGETLYQIRPYYDLTTDLTSHDDRGGAVLVGSRNGATTLGGHGGNRLPAPRLEGQRLKRTRLGSEMRRRDDDPEPKSEKAKVNDSDKAKGVVFVQAAKEAP